jgi:hypothetical protein
MMMMMIKKKKLGTRKDYDYDYSEILDLVVGFVERGKKKRLLADDLLTDDEITGGALN